LKFVEVGSAISTIYNIWIWFI